MMTDLFDDRNAGDNGPSTADQPAENPIADARLKHTPKLPENARAYRRRAVHRVGADPIGLAGLPATRGQLDRLLIDLCNRLASAGGRIVSARRLTDELGLGSERTLRLLMAYGHVHHRIRQLVGLEGVGYCWGDGPAAEGGVYAKAAGIARRKGLCSMFLASLYGKTPAAVAMAQMALEFAGRAEGLGADELDAWMAAEDVTPAKLIEAFVDVFAATDDGRAALAAAARKRPGIFLDAEAAERLRAGARQILGVVERVKR